MNRAKLILATTALVISCAASAQNLDDDTLYGKWGATAEERASNIGASNFLKEALECKDYADATVHFQQLLRNCPGASMAIFSRGIMLYKNRINRANNMEDKRRLTDSLMLIYDMRNLYFGNNEKYGRSYILDLKARDAIKYCQHDRRFVRNTLKSAIEAAIEDNRTKTDIIARYFDMLCDDYIYDDTITKELILSEYKKLSPYFKDLYDEYSIANKSIFENSFSEWNSKYNM